ncbi:hypothetical protein [Microbispora sp. NPDC049125]|uniref:hypothetical protein n=1 Tax=Microbispora sp. NPDC049125 TaxID=3154929 RepID=UPI0034660BA9
MKSTRSSTAVRTLWAVVAVPVIAFALFEIIKHRGWTIPLALIAALAPDLPYVLGGARSLRKAADLALRLLHNPLLPLAVIIFFSFYGDTNDDAAPGFTFGLVWLAHIAVHRALTPSPRLRPAPGE